MKNKKALMSIINFLLIALFIIFKTTNYLEKNAIIVMLILVFISNVIILLMTNKRFKNNDLLDILSFLTNSIVLILIIFNFVFFTSVVEGQSMLPTIDHGERLYINKFLVKIKHDDIVVYKNNDDYIVKRVAAIEGDIIEIKSSFIDNSTNYYIYINGELYKNKYNQNYKLLFSDKLYHQAKEPYELKAGEIILLGDNENLSHDSRQDGIYNTRYLVGKRIGKIKWVKIQGTNKSIGILDICLSPLKKLKKI